MNKEEVKQREQKRILGILEKTLDGEDWVDKTQRDDSFDYLWKLYNKNIINFYDKIGVDKSIEFVK